MSTPAIDLDSPNYDGRFWQLLPEALLQRLLNAPVGEDGVVGLRKALDQARTTTLSACRMCDMSGELDDPVKSRNCPACDKGMARPAPRLTTGVELSDKDNRLWTVSGVLDAHAGWYHVSRNGMTRAANLDRNKQLIMDDSGHGEVVLVPAAWAGAVAEAWPEF